jgi:hypothetical protein
MGADELRAAGDATADAQNPAQGPTPVRRSPWRPPLARALRPQARRPLDVLACGVLDQEVAVRAALGARRAGGATVAG